MKISEVAARSVDTTGVFGTLVAVAADSPCIRYLGTGLASMVNG